MTLELRDLLQQKWDSACRAKGYVARPGMETRSTESGDMYQLVCGFGRVQYDPLLGGWIAVLAVQGFEEATYRYVKLDTALVADPLVTERRTDA